MRHFKSIDWFLYILILLLMVISIVVIFSITYHTPKQNLAISQAIYAIIGLGLLITFTLLDYRTLASASTVLYIIGVMLLILVLFLGRAKLGSTRWIDLGFFNFQPSEIFKIILILSLSKFLVRIEDFKIQHFMFSIVVIILGY